MQVNVSYRDIFKVALPIIAGNIAQTVINVTDTAFLGRVNETVLAASAIGGIFYLIFTLVAMGFAVGPQVMIARRTGEGNINQIGPVFDQGFYLLLIFGLTMLIIIKTGSSLFLNSLLKSPEIYDQAMIYLDYRAWGILFASINMVFRALYIGLSITRILTFSTVMMAIVNVIFNYLLIFGNYGFPAMGIAGSALASVIAEAAATVFFLAYTFLKLDFRKYTLFRFGKWSNEISGKILNLSYPTVFQFLVSIGAWFIFFVMIERIGQTGLAVSNVIRSLLMMLMMPLWGLATAINTMAGNILGQNKASEIKILTRRILTLGYSYILIVLPLVIFHPDTLIRLITNESSIVEAARNSFYVVYAAHFVFIPGIVWLNILIGAGDTKTSFLIELTAIIIYLIYTWLVTIKLQSPLEIIWGAEVVYWSVIGLLSFLRMRGNKWQTISV